MDSNSDLRPLESPLIAAIPPAPASGNLQPWLRWRLIIFIGLPLLGLALAAITYFWNRSFEAKKLELAIEWRDRGDAALKDRDQEEAIADLRTALFYDRDNTQYRLRLAQALLAAGHLDEARAHLLSLWETGPGDGLLNLELARVEALQHHLYEASRFYHAAIYGVWEQDPETQRRQARLELINLLLQQGEKTQARAELIALSAALPNTIAWKNQLAGLLMNIQDYEGALAEYERALRQNGNNPTALAGAGEAAYQLGRYRLANRYLRAADANQASPQLNGLLQTTEMVLKLSPYEPNLSLNEQYQRALSDFEWAGLRLQQCAQATNQDLTAASPTTPLQQEYSRWSQLKRSLNLRAMDRDPELMDRAMQLVFEAEGQVQNRCSPALPEDTALLSIANQEEAEK